MRRETSTMPQWAGSCWYYLRYLQPWNAERLVDPATEQYWLPVDLYVGAYSPASCIFSFGKTCPEVFTMAVASMRTRERKKTASELVRASAQALVSLTGRQCCPWKCQP